MKPTPRTRILTVAVATAFALAVNAFAASIGVVFVENNNGGIQNGNDDSLSTSEEAGAPGFEQVNWNNFGRWGQTVSANDSAGNVSGVTLTWDSNNTWHSGAGTSTSNHKLMSGYLDSTRQQNWDVANPGTLGSFWWNENKPEIFVNNLSGWLAAQNATNYTVVIYVDSDSTSGGISEYWLQSPNDANDPPTLVGADLTPRIFVSDGGTFSGTFMQVPSTANTSGTAGAGNYLVFSNLTANEFILRTEDTYNGAAAAINGVQIIPDIVVPIIDVQPAVTPTTIFPGDTFTLTVAASGRPTLFYQWRQDESPISGATNATYVKTNAVLADTGNYDVVVSNSYGSVTGFPVFVFVNSDTAPFNAVVHPAAATRVTGSSMTFAVTADGTAPFTYQWQLEGTPLADQTNSTLTLTNLTLADGGNYTCAVSNNLGGTISSAGTLTVQAVAGTSTGINFTESPYVTSTAFGVESGDWVNLFGATGTDFAVGSLIYTWTAPNMWHQGVNPPAPGDDEVFYSYLDDGSENSVVISNLNAVFNEYVVRTLGSTDNGNAIQNLTITNGPVVLSYPTPQPNGSGGVTAVSTVSPALTHNAIRLRGGARAGSTRACLAGIVITDKPVIQDQPQAPIGTIYSGGSFTLTGLDVLGVPALSYQWRQDGVDILGANSATLTKSGVTSGDAGNYDVIVTNAYGAATSAVVAVTISDSAPINVVVTPPTRIGYIGGSASFNVIAGGSQPFTYQWNYGGSPILGENGSTLTLLNLTTNEAGHYSCTVSNSIGSATSADATLTVLPLPDGYAGEVLVDEPLAYYRLSQPARAINSGSAGAPADGIYFGGVTRSHDGALAGDADTSAGFTLAKAQPVIIPNNAALNTSTFTVEAWVKPTIEGLANAASPLMNRVSNDGASGRQGWVFFQRAASGQTPPDGNGSGFNFRMYQAGTSSTVIDITGGSYNTNEWTHLAATFDGTTARLYVNGVEAVNGVASGTYAPNTLQGLGIGAWTELDFGTIYQNPFEGFVDEVALYTNVLSDVQLLAHYENGTNASRTTPYEDLVTATDNAAGYYRLNEPDAVNSGTLGSSADGHFASVGDLAGAATPAFEGLEADNLAKSFNGTNSSIGLGNTAGLNLSGQITLEAWIRPATNQGAFANVISHGVNASDTAEVALRILGGFYQIGSWDGANGPFTEFPIPAEDLTGTNWVHLVGTYDGANWNLYRNGSLVASDPGAFGAVLVNDANWAIGSSGDDPSFAQGFRGFNGGIDEAAIYDTALSADRIQAHYFMAKFNTITPTPTLSIDNSGGTVTVTWSFGTLLEADEVTGPWTTNNAASPYIVAPTDAQKFFRVQVP